MTRKTSFALQYRKRLLAEQQCEQENKRFFRKSGAKIREPGRGREKRAEPADSTASSRARFIGAMLVAGLVLAILNSEGLAHWSRGLSATAAGRQVFALSMQWHEWMQTGFADRLVAQIRGTVMAARQAAWQDMAQPFAAAPEEEGIQSADSGDTAGDITGSIPAPPSQHVSRP